MAIIMIGVGYSEYGWRGAIGMAVTSFFMNLWDLLKFAIVVLILSLVLQQFM
jgi:hypothetical protein